ncbi:cysteine desulfurase family protein [Echinicola salinicaeni]|uniref:cysteine desulfurase family protein n=1 Tax=Echinicola salinicaeni TaxID=2762757 RepID=UPI001644E579|nr:cysteine desulfurase family protein [Echinicola salinicaeni]
MNRPIYLDYCSTTPCDPKVVEAMMPYFTEFYGNASSNDHYYGWLAKEAIEISKEQIGDLLNCNIHDIFYTSGATEAINWALKGLAKIGSPNKKHFITTQVEHSAVLETFKYLEDQGVAISYLPVDQNGQLDLELLKASIRKDTIAICCMAANNELGTIYPIDSISAIAKKNDLYFISDATQAVGKIPVDLSLTNVDLLALSSHKIYGPKGIGALIINNPVLRKSLPAFIHGGKQEAGKRSGTINVSGAVGFGKAAELCKIELMKGQNKLSQFRDKLENALLEIPGIIINARKGKRLDHVSNITIENIDAETLLLSLSKKLALSRGSACSSIVQNPSHVLKAIGLEDNKALNSIRISLGRFTTEEEVEQTIGLIREAVHKLQPSI